MTPIPLLSLLLIDRHRVHAILVRVAFMGGMIDLLRLLKAINH